MQINKHSKLLLSLSMLWAFLLCALGAWWLYLLIALGERLEEISEVENGPNIMAIVKWEGGSFLLLLFLLSASLFFLFLKDQKKTKALQDFFASLTHELKTPLASIRLQAEVIRNILDKAESSKLEVLTERMIEDTSKLETQMDKILQLSRLERGGELPVQPIELINFLNGFSQEEKSGIKLEVQGAPSIVISADEFALELILKNLIENTRNHSGSEQALISIKKKEDGMVEVIYSDSGTFNGDRKKLGTLFYKHESSKGSGIGVYLMGMLMSRMGGKLSFEFTPTLKTILEFCPAEEE